MDQIVLKKVKNIQPQFSRHRTGLIAVLCLFGLCMMSFAAGTKKKPKANDERVYLIHSDELYFDQFGPNPDAQIVKGKVRFRHKGGFLNCDSAYFYQEQNSVRAMGHVRYTQGDTLSLVCERGFYDGQNEMMEARRNVVLKHYKRTLTTDSLNYDRVWENAYFYDGGKLVDGKDQLVSDWGSYNTSTKQAVFYYNVVMLSDHRRVETDTLYYDTNTSMAHVVGPSRVYNDSTIINTDNGFFDNKNDRSELFGRSTIIDGQKTIIGDSLYYNKENGQAEGYGNVIYIDTENSNELHGDELQYNEQTGYGYVTKKALVKDYSQQDTLYLHSDTIKVFTFNINTDSVYRKVHCYNKVRVYRADLQAICDSLVGDSRDSCMTMYHNPIVWSDERQVLGDVITVYSNDSTIRETHVDGHALSVEKCDEDNHYNQIASSLLHAYFEEGALRCVIAEGNVQVIFYPIDEEDSTLMLLNYTETDTLKTYMSSDRQLEKIWVSKHVSDMYPMTQIPPDRYRLQNFAWFEDLRPKDKDDIYEWRGKSEELELEESAPIEAPLQKLEDDAPAPTNHEDADSIEQEEQQEAIEEAKKEEQEEPKEEKEEKKDE